MPHGSPPLRDAAETSSPSIAALRPSAPERLLAWLYTGPLGHLYGVLADISVLLARHWAARLRARRR